MKLHELLQGIEVLEQNADPELELTGVSYDSRSTAPGELFAAISGYATDGHRFIPCRPCARRGLCAVRARHAGAHAVGARARCARGAGAARLQLVRPSGGAPVHDRRDGDERQDDRDLPCQACARADARREGRPHRHDRKPHRRHRPPHGAHDARELCPAGPAAADARCGLHACGDGGLVPCAGAAPRGRYPVHGRCVHEPDGGPPRFP